MYGLCSYTVKTNYSEGHINYVKIFTEHKIMPDTVNYFQVNWLYPYTAGQVNSGVAKGGHEREFAQPSQFLAQPSQTFAQPSQVA